ncbi:MAG: SDR family NAD(P)-dependent oxidoreductase [Candidatus Nanopelagicaceae bacterium]|nr:SDR family NAD(P)-dependent oxidoreductase [Candidatus Nanopelagicaceae bacterium]
MGLELQQCKGHWALVTGASAGIGREFCGQLAAAGINLVMVARRQDLLEALASELAERHGTQSLALPIDLGKPAAAAEVKRRVNAEGLAIRLLVNNAAFGRWGRFEATAAEVYEEMILLNNAAMVSMCHHFLPDLASHLTSAIINISSPAAYQPVPYMAVYAATKAFVQSFSQALYGEWKDRGILVQTMVPGPTATEFDAKAGAYESVLKGRGTPADVVEAALRHLATDAPLAITAKGTYKQRLFAGLFPAKMVIREVAKMFKPPTQ